MFILKLMPLKRLIVIKKILTNKKEMWSSNDDDTSYPPFLYFPLFLITFGGNK